jgi:hypothetical protein
MLWRIGLIKYLPVLSWFQGATSRANPLNGFLVFGLLACWGLWLLDRGIRDDIYDWIGERNAPRWSYIVFGVLCQAPLIAFLVFLHRLGWF